MSSSKWKQCFPAAGVATRIGNRQSHIQSNKRDKMPFASFKEKE